MTEPIVILVPGEPVPFARSGGNSGRRFTPPRQRDAMACIKSLAFDAMAGRPPLEGPLRLHVRATFLAPKSWSQKRVAATRWKFSKPDIDNLVKLAKDSLNSIVYGDDAQVVSLSAEKMYASIAALLITVQPMTEAE